MPEDILVPSARSAVERIAYSPAEAAKALGVSRPTIYKLIDDGVLRRFHIGRCARIPAADLIALTGGAAGDS